MGISTYALDSEFVDNFYHFPKPCDMRGVITNDTHSPIYCIENGAALDPVRRRRKPEILLSDIRVAINEYEAFIQ